LISLDLMRIVIVSGAMVYASYQDWISREVDDRIWIVSGAIGGLLTAIDIIARWDPRLAILTVLSIVLASGLAFAFYYFGLYGGADAKAIVIISIGLPIYYSPRSLHPFTGLASLSNGLLLSLFLLLVMFVWNLSAIAKGRRIFEGFEREGKLRKLAAMFLGVRVKNAREKKFWFSLEKDENGNRKFSFDLFELELKEPERNDCWMTPGIPLLIFITGGFLCYIILGDFLYLFIEAVL